MKFSISTAFIVFAFAHAASIVSASPVNNQSGQQGGNKNNGNNNGNNNNNNNNGNNNGNNGNNNGNNNNGGGNVSLTLSCLIPLTKSLPEQQQPSEFAST
jgi:hypothetical protein